MKLANTTKFLFDNGEYFAAHTEDGGARFGMNGVVALQVAADHVLYSEIIALTVDKAEDFLDAQIEAGRIDIRIFGRI